MAMTAAEKRVATMRHHDALVYAAHEAIATLLAPFSPTDEIPGTIEDAVSILRSALAPGSPSTNEEV